ncbi:MAG: dihydrolipoyl dehydrogenase [Paracoccus sp. (in: a-proteobacteria)]|uniref:dihydrolipoyl dehydrogenase n=1 Tax=Paracoccus sp. TaxID=267 RepID=UPI00391DD359
MTRPATLTCDVAVIGAGSAGLSAERAAGARTLLIDPDFDGTLCATAGCMPSKLLIAAARAAHHARRAAEFGISAGNLRIDGPRVMARVRRERDRFARLTRDSFDDLPEGAAIRGRARFAGPGRLVLTDGRGIRARAIVIATGSAPVIPDAFRDLGDAVLTTDTLFDQPDLPRRLAVVGGGPIGLEIAQAMGRLGAEVTLFDGQAVLGKARCPDVHAALRAAVAQDVILRLGCSTRAARAGDKVRISWQAHQDDPQGCADGEALFDHVLIATGRAPALEGLDLPASGLHLDDRGTPVFDRDTMQCGDAPVFLAGDANADAPLLHEASDEGAIAGRNAARFPHVAAARRSIPFTLTFTDPPLAAIGVAAEAAAISATSDYGDQGRARVDGQNQGLVRIHADATGRLTGADLCAPGGEHLAHLLAWAIQTGASADDVLALPFYHPTLEEGLRPALRQICRQAALPQPPNRDSGCPAGS